MSSRRILKALTQGGGSSAAVALFFNCRTREMRPSFSFISIANELVHTCVSFEYWYVMEPFVSSFQNRIDKKGRVSVPASFRAILAKSDTAGDTPSQLFCYSAIDVNAIEAGGTPLVSKIYQLLEDLPPYSEERDILSSALFGASINLKIDSDGRIIVPQELRDYAKIEDYVTFVGMGDKFRIWSPELFETYMQDAREKAILHRKLFAQKAR